MISVQTVKLLLVFLLSLQALAQELNSTLYSNEYGAPVAYTNEMVVFTCVVRRSNSMAWTSEEYIGTGGQRLELSAAEPIGTSYSAVGNNQTVAELINAIIDEIIVSQLRIRIKSTYSIASVQCLNINAGTMTSIEFLPADETSVVCDKLSVCPGETVTVTCTCSTGNSNTLAWIINRERLMFASNDLLKTRRDVNGSDAYTVLTNSSNTNGIMVIVSNLTFIASDSVSNALTCENVDRSVNRSIIIPVTEFSIVMTVESCAGQAMTPAGNGDALGSCAGPIAASVVVPVIIILIIAVPIVITLFVVCYRQH